MFTFKKTTEIWRNFSVDKNWTFALDKLGIRNKLVNRETVIYTYVGEKYPCEKAVEVKKQLHSNMYTN